jgi:ATP-dependent DNA ligase
VYDRAVDRVDTRTLRPQAFGRRNVKDIADPLIEPMWRGDRVIVHISGSDLRMVDTEGEPVTDDVEAIVVQLRSSVLADGVVLDGYLTRQATPAPGTVYLVGSELPTAGQMTTQLLVGSGLRARALTKLEPEAPDEEKSNPLAFVAVDLIVLDDEPLVDIPLLERKRLLESVLTETTLVRRGAYVRLPVDTWLASWRTLGFHELAYKAANGRYYPGSVNDTWAITRIPTT